MRYLSATLGGGDHAFNAILSKVGEFYVQLVGTSNIMCLSLYYMLAGRLQAMEATNLLKTESCHGVNFVVTDGTGGCRYDNLRYHQWWLN